MIKIFDTLVKNSNISQAIQVGRVINSRDFTPKKSGRLSFFLKQTVYLILTDKNIKIIATAGDDSTILISTCRFDTKIVNMVTSSWRTFIPIENHTSSISSLKSFTICTKNDFKKLILVAVGGRSSIYIYKIHFNEFCTNEIKLEETFRIKRVKSISSTIKSSNDTDPSNVDLRATAIDIKRQHDHLILIIGFSDGIIRLFALQLSSYQVDYLKEFTPQNGMVTNLKLYQTTNILATYTNGVIALYSLELFQDIDLPKYPQPKNLDYFQLTRNSSKNPYFDILACIDSSIGSLCVIESEQTEIYVGTHSGSVYQINNQTKKYPNFHSGSVNILGTFQRYLVSGSSDRRLEIRDMVTSYTVQAETFTSVNDPCSLSIISHNDDHLIIVAGIGIEVFLCTVESTSPLIQPQAVSKLIS
ncbi:hypothetical protein RF11_04486 [Thelohanellus kitauei]|uniref:Uncharacterized protein n=1 Tax=Thelohanellus kitauei TaxID=669202 RepID=A0A0C2J5J6_THEKT|nr:hypothetical protein RF11_04486 [Thelohanellus kitauei]